MTRKKYLIAFGIVILLGCAIGYVMSAREKNEPAVPLIDMSPSNPVAEYVIPADEMEGFQTKASNGDCKAAYRLALYHENVTAQVWDAIKWLRLAAKCPDVRPKEELIMLLVPIRDQPGVAAEIDKVFSELKAIDPERAAVIKREMDTARPVGS